MGWILQECTSFSFRSSPKSYFFSEVLPKPWTTYGHPRASSATVFTVDGKFVEGQRTPLPHSPLHSYGSRQVLAHNGAQWMYWIHKRKYKNWCIRAEDVIGRCSRAVAWEQDMEDSVYRRWVEASKTDYNTDYFNILQTPPKKGGNGSLPIFPEILYLVLGKWQTGINRVSGREIGAWEPWKMPENLRPIYQN